MAERQVALVTGASSGIGEAIAGQLAATGFRVFGGSRTAAADNAAAVEHVALDVRDDASVHDCVGQIRREAGRIDVLVNNAGYLCAGAVYARPQPAGIDAYAGPRGRVFAAAAELERKAPGPEVVARTVVSIARDPQPALRNKVTRQTRQVTLLKRFTPAAAFEAGVRRTFNLQTSDTALPAAR